MSKAYLSEYVRNSRKEHHKPVSKMSKADLMKEYEKYRNPHDVMAPATKSTSMTGKLIRSMKHLEKVEHEPRAEHKAPEKKATKTVHHEKAVAVEKPKKAMSPYNQYVSKHRKMGHTMSQIAEMWKASK